MTSDYDSDPASISASLLHRYSVGEVTAEERAHVERWWRATSAEDRVGHAFLAQSAQAEVPETQSVERMWERIQARTLTGSPLTSLPTAAAAARDTPRTPLRHRATLHNDMGWTWALRITAAALVAIAVVIGVVVQSHARVTRSAVLAEHVYATRSGQQADVTLPDGSRAILAPATTLRVTTSGATQGTVVDIDGEAIFRVARHVRTPFDVRTRSATTHVLGTEFSVRQYASDRVARVVVSEGRVSLRGLKDPTVAGAVMAANTVGLVDDSGHIDITPHVTAKDYTAWTTGELVFLRTPTRQIVADLARAYGVDIRVVDSTLAEHTVTWSVPIRWMTLAGALEALTDVIDAHVVRSGNTITIVPGRTSLARPRHRDSLTMQEHTYGR